MFKVSADEPHLEQALKNIVRNALRRTPPGGVIALIVTVAATSTLGDGSCFTLYLPRLYNILV